MQQEGSRQQHFIPTVGLLSSEEFLNKTFPRIAAMFPMILGHVDALPANGDYYVSPHSGNTIFLHRGEDGIIRAFPNTCTHRNGQLIPAGKIINNKEIPRQGKTAGENVIRCPWHNKAYSDRGKAFDRQCSNLHQIPIEVVGGLIFTGGKHAEEQLSGLKASPGFAKYKLDPLAEGVKLALVNSTICDEPYTAATGMAIFGDDAHVSVIHKGTFNAMVAMKSLHVEKGEEWSAQFVEWGGFSKEVSPEYADYIAEVRKVCGASVPQIGAIWVAYGANITLEWYQCGPESGTDCIMVLSTYIPKGHRTDISIEVYAPQNTLPELTAAFWKAYMKTAAEDKELCVSVDEGQRALALAGHEHDPVGPMGEVVEECVEHYYDFLGKCLDLQNIGSNLVPIRKIRV